MFKIKNTFSTLKKFAENSQRGESHVYYQGFLVRDRSNDNTTNIIAEEALEYYQRGVVELVQRKISDCEYQYIAVRSAAGKRPFVGAYNQDPVDVDA